MVDNRVLNLVFLPQTLQIAFVAIQSLQQCFRFDFGLFFVLKINCSCKALNNCLLE